MFRYFYTDSVNYMIPQNFLFFKLKRALKAQKTKVVFYEVKQSFFRQNYGDRPSKLSPWFLVCRELGVVKVGVKAAFFQ